MSLKGKYCLSSDINVCLSFCRGDTLDCFRHSSQDSEGSLFSPNVVPLCFPGTELSAENKVEHWFVLALVDLTVCCTNRKCDSQVIFLSNWMRATGGVSHCICKINRGQCKNRFLALAPDLWFPVY